MISNQLLLPTHPSPKTKCSRPDSQEDPQETLHPCTLLQTLTVSHCPALSISALDFSIITSFSLLPNISALFWPSKKLFMITQVLNQSRWNAGRVLLVRFYTHAVFHNHDIRKKKRPDRLNRRTKGQLINHFNSSPDWLQLDILLEVLIEHFYLRKELQMRSRIPTQLHCVASR